MIAIETQWFIFLYLLLFLATVLIAWVGYELHRVATGRRAREHTLRCPNCGMVFFAPPESERAANDIVSCPRCEAKIEVSIPKGKARGAGNAAFMDE